MLLAILYFGTQVIRLEESTVHVVVIVIVTRNRSSFSSFPLNPYSALS